MKYRNAATVLLSTDLMEPLKGQETPLLQSAISDPQLGHRGTNSRGNKKVSQRLGRTIWFSAIRTSQKKVQRRPSRSGQDRLIRRKLRRRKLSLRKMRRLSASMLNNAP